MILVSLQPTLQLNTKPTQFTFLFKLFRSGPKNNMINNSCLRITYIKDNIYKLFVQSSFRNNFFEKFVLPEYNRFSFNLRLNLLSYISRSCTARFESLYFELTPIGFACQPQLDLLLLHPPPLTNHHPGST